MGLNREYLQTQIASADPEDNKSSVRFATTGAIPAYNRVENVITAVANGAFPVQDGVSPAPAAGEDFLFWHGVSDSDNGIYTITQLGDGSNPFILTRRSDADTDEFVTAGMRVPIEEGVLYAGQTFVLMTPNPIVLNTTGLTFEVGESASAASPVFLDGETEAVLESRRLLYSDDIQLEDDGDLIPEGDVQTTESFDNHIISKVTSRQIRVVHEWEVMFIAPDLTIDGELVVDGQLDDFPEVPVSASNVLNALDEVLNVQELLGKTNPVGGVGPSTVNDWLNPIKNAAVVSHQITGTVDGYAFVDAGGDVEPWLKAEVAYINADTDYEGLIIRGLYVDTAADGFVASKIIINDGAVSLISFIDEEEDDGADPVFAYRIVNPEQYGYNFVLAPKEACRIVYNSTRQRWVLAGISAGSREINTFLTEASYATFPDMTYPPDRTEWLVADFAALYPAFGNVVIDGLAKGQYLTTLNTYLPARRVKVIVNRASGSNTITFTHQGSPGDPDDVIWTDTQNNIVLNKNEMAIAMYAQGKWFVAKFPGLHGPSHESGGEDEIDVTNLGGLLADAQTPLAHDFGGASHNADTLADINTKVSDAILFGSAYSEMSLHDNATVTTLSAEPTFTRIAGTYSWASIFRSFSLVNGSGGSIGALQYTGALTKVFQVVVQISCSFDTAYDEIAFRIGVNGSTASAKAEARQYVAADEETVVMTALLSLNQNDYVEVFAARAGASANVLVDELSITIVAVG